MEVLLNARRIDFTGGGFRHQSDSSDDMVACQQRMRVAVVAHSLRAVARLTSLPLKIPWRANIKGVKVPMTTPSRASKSTDE